METVIISCPKCNLPVLPTFYFCPNCAKQLRAKPLEISVGKQFGVYFTSFFFPPFGLIPAVKYLRQEGTAAKTIGMIALALTILSLVIAIYSIMSLAQSMNQLLGTASGLDQSTTLKQLQQLQQLNQLK